MKRIKDFVARILYLVVNEITRLFPVKQGSNKLLLIKNDEIGDYLLFRSFLREIRTSAEYKNFHITLIGNLAWKQLFDQYDKEYVDQVIWVNKKEFKQNIFYRLRLLKEVRQKQFSDVVNCIYSKTLLNDDCFTYVVNSKIKSAMKFNPHSSLQNTDFLYNQTIETGSINKFDFIRNIDFFSALLDRNLGYVSIAIDIGISKNIFQQEYCVIFPGAGKKEKLWSPAHFAEVIGYIKSKYNILVILGGGPGDMQDSDNVAKTTQSVDHNLTGKNTMPESLALLKHAKFMLSVDTGSVHMGTAVGCPAIALYSGRDYGRFGPYPKTVFAKFYSIFSDRVDRFLLDNGSCIPDPNMYEFSEISSILPGKVMPFIDLILNR